MENPSSPPVRDRHTGLPRIPEQPLGLGGTMPGRSRRVARGREPVSDDVLVGRSGGRIGLGSRFGPRATAWGKAEAMATFGLKRSTLFIARLQSGSLLPLDATNSLRSNRDRPPSRSGQPGCRQEGSPLGRFGLGSPVRRGRLPAGVGTSGRDLARNKVACVGEAPRNTLQNRHWFVTSVNDVPTISMPLPGTAARMQGIALAGPGCWR